MKAQVVDTTVRPWKRQDREFSTSRAAFADAVAAELGASSWQQGGRLIGGHRITLLKALGPIGLIIFGKKGV